MKVNVRVEASDYLKFIEYQMTHSKQGKKTILLQRLILPLISTAMIIAFVVFNASTKALIIEVVSLGIASIIWVIGAPEMLKSNIRRDFYRNKAKGRLPFRERSVLDFGEEGISEVSGNYKDFTPYSSIRYIVKADDNLYIYTEGESGFLIPLNNAARNGRKIADLLSKKTGIEIISV